MKEIKAVELRQSLRQVLEQLEATREPVLLKRGKKEAAVLISLEDFRKRFVEKAAEQERRQILQSIQEMARPSGEDQSSEHLLRTLRAGGDDPKTEED